jgi:hypothetical protein
VMDDFFEILIISILVAGKGHCRNIFFQKSGIVLILISLAPYLISLATYLLSLAPYFLSLAPYFLSLAPHLKNKKKLPYKKKKNYNFFFYKLPKKLAKNRL